MISSILYCKIKTTHKKGSTHAIYHVALREYSKGYRAKNYGEAKKWFNKLLLINNVNPSAHFYMGHIHAQDAGFKDTNQAIYHYEKALKINPKYEQAQQNLEQVRQLHNL